MEVGASTPVHNKSEDLMDKHGIGTDASIPQHIQTIQDRHYVQLTDGDGQAILPSRWPPGKAAPKRAPGRFLVATPRGVALVKGAFGRMVIWWMKGGREAIKKQLNGIK